MVSKPEKEGNADKVVIAVVYKRKIFHFFPEKLKCAMKPIP